MNKIEFYNDGDSFKTGNFPYPAEATINKQGLVLCDSTTANKELKKYLKEKYGYSSNPLTKPFLKELKKKFPLLERFKPFDGEFHTNERPVKFETQKHLPENYSFQLEYGKYNSWHDPSYTNGVTDLFVLFPNKEVQRISLQDGITTLEMLNLPDSWVALIERWQYQSMLVDKDLGTICYRYWRNTSKAQKAMLSELDQRTSEAAQLMSE